MKQRIILGLGIIFIVGGLIVGFQPFKNWVLQPDPVVQAGPPMNFDASSSALTSSALKSNQVIAGIPSHIEIPSVDISLPVEDGFYNPKTNGWTLSLDKAHYATITTPANNQGGNTFIYGHNRWEVFYRLPKIKVGDKAIVTTKNNHKFVYKLSRVKTTKPTDTSLFNYQGAPILTLQTCTGMWYQNRTLFIFQLVEVN